MKVCEYCDSVVDDANRCCPHCGAILPVGQPVDHVVERISLDDDPYQWGNDSDEASDESTISGINMAWRVVATLFIPFVGGYALLNPRVVAGGRIFGLIWCLMFAVTAVFLEPFEFANVVVILLFSGPVIVYFARKARQTTPDQRKVSTADIVGVAVGVVLGLLVGLSD